MFRTGALPTRVIWVLLVAVLAFVGHPLLIRMRKVRVDVGHTLDDIGRILCTILLAVFGRKRR